MTFYLLATNRPYQIQIKNERVAFSEIVEVGTRGQLFIIVNSAGTFRLFQVKTGIKLRQIRLVNYAKSMEAIIYAQYCSLGLFILTFSTIYFLSVSEIETICHQQTNNQMYPIRELQFDTSEAKYLGKISKLMSKTLKITKKDGNCFLKLAGRTKDNLVYYYFSFTKQLSLTLLYQFQQSYPNQFSISLQSPQPDISIFQTSITKFKPIKLYTIDFSKQSTYKTQSALAHQLIKQYDILQFSEKLSIIQVARINYKTVYLICSEHFEEKESSLVIVYNLKDKNIINYIQVHDTMITYARMFGNKFEKEYGYQNSSVFIDAVSNRDNGCAQVMQIYPFCAEQQHKNNIKGRIVSISDNFIVAVNQQSLKIIPKIHKSTIYQFWLQTMLPNNFRMSNQILQLLTQNE